MTLAPDIAILMSAYNGSKYLIPQLDSIFQQEAVTVHLYVRDDASSDDTVALLREYREKHGVDIVVLESGEEGNVGVYASWELLLGKVPDAFDYYAISDQDDVWLQGKLSSAVEWLASHGPGPALCTCNTTAVDENLSVLREYRFDLRPLCLESLFARYSIPAHSMVFNRELMCLARSYRGEDLSDRFHLEPRIVLSCLACGGVWVRDEKSYVLWRRLASGNVSAPRKGLFARLRYEMVLFRRKDQRFNWARALLENPRCVLTPGAERFLHKVVSARGSVAARLEIARSEKFRTGIPAGDVEAKIRVLLPRW